MYCSSLVYCKLKQKQHCCFVWLILSVIKTVLTNVTQWKHLNARAVNHMSAFFLRHMSIQVSGVEGKSSDHMSSRKSAYQG